jgi:hypothetical protein
MDTDGSAVTGLRRVTDGIDPALSPIQVNNNEAGTT